MIRVAEPVPHRRLPQLLYRDARGEENPALFLPGTDPVRRSHRQPAHEHHLAARLSPTRPSHSFDGSPRCCLIPRSAMGGRGLRRGRPDSWRPGYPVFVITIDDATEVTESRDSRRPAAAGGCWQRGEFLRSCDRDRTSTRGPRPCYLRGRSPGHCLGTQRMRVQPHIGPSDVTRSEVEHSAEREPDVPNRGIVRRSVFNALDAAGRRTRPGRTLRTDRGNPIIPFVGEHVGITQHGANRA